MWLSLFIYCVVDQYFGQFIISGKIMANYLVNSSERRWSIQYYKFNIFNKILCLILFYLDFQDTPYDPCTLN